jgi:hypothetical protein
VHPGHRSPRRPVSHPAGHHNHACARCPQPARPRARPPEGQLQVRRACHRPSAGPRPAIPSEARILHQTRCSRERFAHCGRKSPVMPTVGVHVFDSGWEHIRPAHPDLDGHPGGYVARQPCGPASRAGASGCATVQWHGLAAVPSPTRPARLDPCSSPEARAACRGVGEGHRGPAPQVWHAAAGTKSRPGHGWNGPQAS